MLMRTAAALALTLAVAQGAASSARAEADELCKPGHLLDRERNVCYDPATAYRPNVPPQTPVFGSGPQADAKPQSAPATPKSGGSGFLGWLGDQARFCRFGDRQVGSGDAAYCVDRNGRSYPAGK
ncbi:MAG: hypothetical protein ACM30I_08425 [Gemmatimonas sp.]